MPLNGTDSKAGVCQVGADGRQTPGRPITSPSCGLMANRGGWVFRSATLTSFASPFRPGTLKARRRRIRPLSLTKTHLATGIIVRFPYIRPAGRNIDIAEFVLVLVLGVSARRHDDHAELLDRLSGRGSGDRGGRARLSETAASSTTIAR